MSHFITGISVHVPVALWQAFETWKSNSSTKRVSQISSSVASSDPITLTDPDVDEDPSSNTAETAAPVASTLRSKNFALYRYCFSLEKRGAGLVNGEFVQGDPEENRAFISHTGTVEEDDLFRRRRTILHNKTVHHSRNSLHQSLFELQGKDGLSEKSKGGKGKQGGHLGGLRVATCEADLIEMEKLAPLQLPVRVYASNDQNPFEAIIYDIDEPSGQKYCSQPRADGKTPRSMCFIQVVKVPEGSRVESGDMFPNVFKAASAVSGGSTESGWLAWSVKLPNPFTQTTERVSLGCFRLSDKSQITNGSGFIRSPHSNPVYRDVLARACKVNGKPIEMIHTSQDLQALGLSQSDFNDLDVNAVCRILEQGVSI